MSDAATFRAVHARAATWHAALRACLGQLDPQPAGATLGLVYLGAELAPFADDVVRALREATGIAAWAGASGEAALGCAPSRDDGRGLAVLVGALPRGSFRVIDAGAPAGARPGSSGATALVHAELGGREAGPALRSLVARTDAYLVGAVSSPSGGRAQIAGAVGEGGVSSVLLGRGVLALPILAGSGLPIGPACRITSRVGERIFALDGRPALDVVLERLGDLARARPERLAGELMLADWAPAGRPRPLVRVVAVDARGASLVLEPSALQGPLVMLHRRDPATAERELVAAVANVRARLSGRRAAAVLWFSGASRLTRMLAAGIDEVALIRDALDRPPIVGLAADAVVVEDRIESSAGVGLVLA